MLCCTFRVKKKKNVKIRKTKKKNKKKRQHVNYPKGESLRPNVSIMTKSHNSSSEWLTYMTCVSLFCCDLGYCRSFCCAMLTRSCVKSAKMRRRWPMSVLSPLYWKYLLRRLSSPVGLKITQFRLKYRTIKGKSSSFLHSTGQIFSLWIDYPYHIKKVATRRLLFWTT